MKTLVFFLFLAILTVAASANKLIAAINHKPEYVQLNTASAPKDLRPELYLIVSADQWGSGYYVQTEIGAGITTARHVITDTMEIYRQADGQRVGEPIPWESYICQRPTGESPCLIYVNLETTPQIVRITNLDIANLEFVIWDKDQQLFLPFDYDDYMQCLDFCVVGQQYLNPSTGVTEYAKARQGMSGSSIFVAINGVPQLYNGQLISVGELSTLVTKQSEGVKAIILNTEF